MRDCKNLWAVIWDLDGTILDTQKQHFRSMEYVSKKYGVKFNDQVLKHHYGKTSLDIFTIALGDKFSQDELAEMVDEKEKNYRSIIAEGVEFLPGVKCCLLKFQEIGFKQAIASSTSMENIIAVVSTLNAQSYFTQFFSGEGYPGKPDPAVFLLAASKLELPPSQCLVIEDSPHGVEAAKAAGMKCVAVSLSYSLESLSSADIVLKSLETLDFDAVCGLFSEEVLDSQD